MANLEKKERCAFCLENEHLISPYKYKGIKCSSFMCRRCWEQIASTDQRCLLCRKDVTKWLKYENFEINSTEKKICSECENDDLDILKFDHDDQCRLIMCRKCWGRIGITNQRCPKCGEDITKWLKFRDIPMRLPSISHLTDLYQYQLD